MTDFDHSQNTDSGSRGRPESVLVAHEFLSWRRTEVKLSPPKVAENGQLAVSSFHDMFVWRNEATFVPMFVPV